MKTVLSSLLITLLFCQPGMAATPGAGRLGAGVAIFSPVLLTGKYWLDEKKAVDFGLGFAGSGWTMVYGDFHWNFPGVFGSSSKFLTQTYPYVGVGGALAFWNQADRCNRWGCWYTGTSTTALLLRIPVGVEWFAKNPPLGVFLEIDPTIALLPGVYGAVDLALGIRYYF